MHKTLLGLTLLMSFDSCAYAGPGAWDDQVGEAARQKCPEYLDSGDTGHDDSAADIQRDAAFLQRAFTERGFATQFWRTRRISRRYLHYLLRLHPAQDDPVYVHFDGQPVIPRESSQDDPFRPVVSGVTVTAP